MSRRCTSQLPMTIILHDLPYLDRPETVTIQGEQVRLRPFQIIVWVSVHMKGVADLEPNAPRFPAILDTGNNFTFTITERQLVRWAGIRPGLLRLLGPVVLNDIEMERRAANVWIHSNRRGQRHALKPSASYRLELDRGLAIYPDDARRPGPRLPLLGVRALDDNSLDLRINARRRSVTLKAGRWPPSWFPLFRTDS